MNNSLTNTVSQLFPRLRHEGATTFLVEKRRHLNIINLHGIKFSRKEICDLGTQILPLSYAEGRDAWTKGSLVCQIKRYLKFQTN